MKPSQAFITAHKGEREKNAPGAVFKILVPVFRLSEAFPELPALLESSSRHHYNTHNDNSTIYDFLQLSSTFSNALPRPTPACRRNNTFACEECERRYYINSEET